ncbi:MAG: ferrous iron transport protein B [Thermoproteota archaeon]
MSCHTVKSKNERERIKEHLTIALVAQPNTGKTTLFNTLTGAHAYVANWPGKTIERMEGIFTYKGKNIKIIDLPGIRSLSTLSQEETIAKEFILSGEYDSLIVMVDAETLEKSLYFAVQILEATNKVVIAINKYDEAHALGLHINQDKLQSELNVTTLLISALRGLNINQLIEKTIEVASQKRSPEPAIVINYGILETFIKKISDELKALGFSKDTSRIAAVRLLEGDTFLVRNLDEEKLNKILAYVQQARQEAKERTGFSCEEIIVMSRYKLVEDIIKRTSTRVRVATKAFTESLDRIMLRNFFVGLTFSSLILFSILFFSFSINTGFPLNYIIRALGNEELASLIEEYSLSGILSNLFCIFSVTLESLLHVLNAPYWFIDLTINGVVQGVSAVLTFLPLVFIVNLFMAIAEDSGLMSRVAVVFHRLTSVFNLSGKAVFPMIISLACNVPGVLSSRILENENERIAVSTTISFIICQARLVVLLFFVAAMFYSPLVQSLVTITMYFLSIALFLLSYMFVEKFVLKSKEQAELFIEMPSYHIPSLKVVSWIAWERSKSFITKAGTVIFPMAIIIWALLHIGPSGYVETPNLSFGKMIGDAISKMFVLEGFSKWEIGLALLTGFIAKEVIIETLAISFGTSNPSEAISMLSLSPASALSLLTFVMLYTPCVATVAATYSETKSIKMTLISVLASLSVAYIVSLFMFYIFSLI